MASATPAQLAQDALNIAVDLQTRVQNGATFSEKLINLDICAALQMLAQAQLGVTVPIVSLDPSDSTNVATTTAATEISP